MKPFTGPWHAHVWPTAAKRSILPAKLSFSDSPRSDKVLTTQLWRFCSTAVNALQQDCGEMQLHLMHLQLILKFATKVAVNSTNPAREVTEFHWRAQRGKYEHWKELICALLEAYLSSNQRQLPGRAAAAKMTNTKRLVALAVRATETSRTEAELSAAAIKRSAVRQRQLLQRQGEGGQQRRERQGKLQ